MAIFDNAWMLLYKHFLERISLVLLCRKNNNQKRHVQEYECTQGPQLLSNYVLGTNRCDQTVQF